MIGKHVRVSTRRGWSVKGVIIPRPGQARPPGLHELLMSSAKYERLHGDVVVIGSVKSIESGSERNLCTAFLDKIESLPPRVPLVYLEPRPDFTGMGGPARARGDGSASLDQGREPGRRGWKNEDGSSSSLLGLCTRGGEGEEASLKLSVNPLSSICLPLSSEVIERYWCDEQVRCVGRKCAKYRSGFPSVKLCR